jgi:hypothetical protein
VVEACHGSLRVTRGAAVAVADLDLEAKKVEYCAVGNIAAVIAEGGPDRHLASINGTVGHGPVRSHQFSYAWPDGGILILTSDGLQTHWTLEGHRGLAGRDPALIAGVLYRDHARGRDDSTVVVIKDRAA